VADSYGMAREAMQPLLDDARGLLALHGAAVAAGHLRAYLLAWPEADRRVLAGALGVALVELARLEGGDGR